MSWSSPWEPEFSRVVCCIYCNNLRAMNARYVDSRVPECGTNRAASLPTLCLCLKKTSVCNGPFFYGAQSCRLHDTNVCRTEITFCFVYCSGSQAKYCSDNILGQNIIP
jgi:hypothetical protein